MSNKILRPIAIHLPQFHPIPENDKWWGKGFTEWTNVVKAKPLFEGHYQPHLPSDLGFYDLRLPEAREAQASMAREYGIYGFCYYHYWFNGKRILERPVNDIIELKKPDFPFCVCWANENWTRKWDGNDGEILLKQNYSLEDHKLHMQYLCRNVFSDSRYIRVDNKPLFIVYRSSNIPDPVAAIETWRETALETGIGEIYICRMEIGYHPVDPRDIGFDASIHFHPDTYGIKTLQTKGVNIFNGTRNKIFNNVVRANQVFSYPAYVEEMLSRSKPSYKLYPGVMPGWDNSSRVANNRVIFIDSSPEIYGYWLKGEIEKFKPFSNSENFIFIDAWNEWAEGNHLEPCQKWGHQYLEVTKKILESTKAK